MEREAWQDSLHSPHQPLTRHLTEVPSVSAPPATSLFFLQPAFFKATQNTRECTLLVSRLQKSSDRLSPEQEVTGREYPLVCLRLSVAKAWICEDLLEAVMERSLVNQTAGKIRSGQTRQVFVSAWNVVTFE